MYSALLVIFLTCLSACSSIINMFRLNILAYLDLIGLCSAFTFYRFNFKLAPGHTVKKRLAAVMRADGGIMMQVERRQH